MKSVKINFPNAAGETLAGRLELPVDGKPYAYALFAHCFTCNKNLNAVHNISRALTMKGIAVFRFDFTGLGESEGDFGDTNFSSNMEDLQVAAQYLSDNYRAPELMVGHSLGGAAVLMAASDMDSIKAVVTIGAPAEPTHVTHLFDEEMAKIKEQGYATVSIGSRPFTIKKQFLEDLRNQPLPERIKDMKKALLLLHSPIDTTVGVDNARVIYEAAMHPKSFVSLDQADHLLMNKEDSLYAGEMIATWVKKYLPEPQEEDLETNMQVVARVGEEGYLTEIRAGKHAILADEPTSVGGTDLGPTPYDLLVAGLGACTAMTLRMYADRKKWPLQGVKVHLTHEKRHADDSDPDKENSGKIDFIDREIELEGELDDEQRKRLLEIADKCPVHKTLHSEVKVNSKLRDLEE